MIRLLSPFPASFRSVCVSVFVCNFSEEKFVSLSYHIKRHINGTRHQTVDFSLSKKSAVQLRKS